MSKVRSPTTGLTVKQESFVFNLLTDPECDLTKAAEQAGYANPRRSGKELSNDPKVQKALAKYRKQLEATTLVTAEQVRNRLATLIFRDIRQIVYRDGPDKGKAVPLEDLPDEIVACIDGYEEQERIFTNDEGEQTGREVKRKYKLSTITSNIDLMMKHLGMFEPNQTEVTHKFDFDGLTGPPDPDVMGDDVEDAIKGASVRVVKPNKATQVA